MANKKYRIKKEYLRDDGCFNTGGGVDDEIPFAMREGRKKANPANLPFDEMQQRAAAAPVPEQVPDYGAPAMPISEPQPMPAQPVQQPQANPYMQEAYIQGDIARKQANIAQQSIEQQQGIMDQFANTQKQLASQRDAIVKELEMNPVNAERYMQNKSSAGKVSTAIGLILGGIGGGMTGQGNAALDFLNKQIDRDIESQKAGRAAKENLLSSLERQYGNEQVAANMLSSILKTQMAAKIDQAALASGDKLAVARAQQASMQLRAEADKMQAGLARERVASELYARGMNPVDMGIPVDEKIQGRAVPGYGLANDPELAKKLNTEILPQHESSMQALKQLQGMGRSVNPAERARAEQLQQILIGRTRLALLGPGAITDAEREIAKNVIANPTAIFQLAASDKLQQLESMLNRDFEARIKGAGLKMPQKDVPKQAAPIKSFKPKQ